MQTMANSFLLQPTKTHTHVLHESGNQAKLTSDVKIKVEEQDKLCSDVKIKVEFEYAIIF